MTQDEIIEMAKEAGLQSEYGVSEFAYTDRLEHFSNLVVAKERESLAQTQEPWCMKMNGCKTKCEDCPDEPPQRTWVDLTDEQLRTEFGKLYPNDIGILELAENNRDFAVEAIGARHHWVAFQAGARAAEAKLKEKNHG